MKIRVQCEKPSFYVLLTLAGTRRSAIIHSTRGGGGYDPPRVWLLSALELRLKNQRVACHETKPLTTEFNVLGQPVTSEVRSMTQKLHKKIYTIDPAVTEFQQVNHLCSGDHGQESSLHRSGSRIHILSTKPQIDYTWPST